MDVNKTAEQSSVPFDQAMEFVPIRAMNHAKGIVSDVMKDVIGDINRNFQVTEVRELHFHVLNGMFGVGKTRAVQEICRRATRANPNRIMGFISSASALLSRSRVPDLPHVNERDLQLQSLARALLLAFYKDLDVQTVSDSDHLSSVMKKLKVDFRRDQLEVILHVDEYSVDVEAVDLLICGCAMALTQYGYRVVVLMSGVTPAVGNVNPRRLGSPVTVTFHTLSPFGFDDVTLRRAFKQALQIRGEVEMCEDLVTLLASTGGYAASIVEAIRLIKTWGDDSPSTKQLRSQGIVSTEAAKSIYERLLDHASARYSQVRWYEALGGTLTPVEKEQNRHPLSENSRRLLARVLLCALGEISVKRDDLVNPPGPARNVTFGELEKSGLVTLEAHGDSDSVYVTLPLLAMCVMNGYLDVAQFGILDKPFEVGFQSLERLAMASLACRLRALLDIHGAGHLFDLSDLRRGANFRWLQARTTSMSSSSSTSTMTSPLKIRVPASIQCVNIARVLKKGPLVVDIGAPIPSSDGTIWMAADDEAGVDGGAVLTGVWNGTDVTVMILSQSKSLHKNSNVDDSLIDKTLASDVLSAMAKTRNAWVTTWLGERAMSKHHAVVVVYDLFSDREKDPSLHIRSALSIPAESDSASSTFQVNDAAVFLTSRTEIGDVVGSSLAMRASLKRPSNARFPNENKKAKRSR